MDTIRRRYHQLLDEALDACGPGEHIIWQFVKTVFERQICTPGVSRERAWELHEQLPDKLKPIGMPMSLEKKP